MPDREKVVKAFVLCRVNERCSTNCPYWNDNASIKGCTKKLATDVYSLLKEQEPIKPTINEYGEAYCVCGENVGIIPNSKSLPEIRSKYCSECGRRMKWE